MQNGAGGDPHFLVNLPDNSNLCFSMQGEPGFAFNLVTSEFIVINAVFIDAPPRLKDWSTVIGEIGILCVLVGMLIIIKFYQVRTFYTCFLLQVCFTTLKLTLGVHLC